MEREEERRWEALEDLNRWESRMLHNAAQYSTASIICKHSNASLNAQTDMLHEIMHHEEQSPQGT